MIYEIHFCEGQYLMAKEKDSESGVIDNIFTEFIGIIEGSREEVEGLLLTLTKLNFIPPTYIMQYVYKLV